MNAVLSRPDVSDLRGWLGVKKRVIYLSMNVFRQLDRTK